MEFLSAHSVAALCRRRCRRARYLGFCTPGVFKPTNRKLCVCGGPPRWRERTSDWPSLFVRREMGFRRSARPAFVRFRAVTDGCWPGTVTYSCWGGVPPSVTTCDSLLWMWCGVLLHVQRLNRRFSYVYIFRGHEEEDKEEEGELERVLLPESCTHIKQYICSTTDCQKGHISLLFNWKNAIIKRTSNPDQPNHHSQSLWFFSKIVFFAHPWYISFRRLVM